MAAAALVFIVTLAVSLRAEPAAAPAPAQAADSDKGERLMNASCQGCHAVRVIQVQAKSAEEGQVTP